MESNIPGNFKRRRVSETVEKSHKRKAPDDFDDDDALAKFARGAKIDSDAIPELREWDPLVPAEEGGLPDSFFLVFEGKRRTGKSTFARWLFQYYANKFALVWCMTNTKATGYWQTFVGEEYTFDGWNPAAVHLLIEQNDKVIKQFGEDSEKARELASCLIILDDVISQNIHDDPTFMRLAVEGRHHLISVCLMTQDPKAISPKVRDNADHAVIFNQKTFRNKESVWHDFMNDTCKDFAMALLDKYATEHNALVAVQTNLNSNVHRSFYKSTVNKTVLKFPNYCLGGDKQKKSILEEREKAKEKKRQTAVFPDNTDISEKLTVDFFKKRKL